MTLRASKSTRAQARSYLSIALAGLAGFFATGVSADTLAQPKDDSLERAAAHYVRFREDVAAIEAMAFDSANVTREAHRRLGAHDALSLSRGWVAYAALVAADTPAFKDAVKEEMKRKANRRKGELGGRAGLLSKLSQDPTFARTLSGANDALSAIADMAALDGSRITTLGESFKEQAYAMQRTKWGKARIASSKDRLSEVAAFSSKRGAAPAPAFDRLAEGGVIAPALTSAKGEWAPDWGAATPGGVVDASSTAIMDRILNLAVRYSTDALNPKIVEVYAKNDKSRRCLEMSKLTLDQCIAATRTPYEEAFCLGEHALNDIAACNGWSAGGAS